MTSFTGDEIESFLYKSGIKQWRAGDYELTDEGEIKTWKFQIERPTSKLSQNEYDSYIKQVKDDRKARLESAKSVTRGDIQQLEARIKKLEDDIARVRL